MGAGGEHEDAGTGAGETQRIDKWLWFARLTKTRTLAAELVAAGRVRLNKVRVEKPAQAVHLGDVLTVTLNRRVRILRVSGLAPRRGPSAAARLLYEELTAPADPLKPSAAPSAQISSWQQSVASPGLRAPGSGRPTKKDRRDIDRLNGKLR